MKYRDHRGSLAESLATEQEINSLEQLIAHLEKTRGARLHRLKSTYYTFDHRPEINSNQWIIEAQFAGLHFYPVGFSDQAVPDWTNPADISPAELQSATHRQLDQLRQDHQEALGLLRDCVLQIEYLHQKFRETGTGNNILSHLKAYIQKHGN